MWSLPVSRVSSDTIHHAYSLPNPYHHVHCCNITANDSLSTQILTYYSWSCYAFSKLIRYLGPWSLSFHEATVTTDPDKLALLAIPIRGRLSSFFSAYILFRKKSILQPPTIALIRFSTSMYKIRNIATSNLDFNFITVPGRFFLFFSLSPTLIAREK